MHVLYIIQVMCLTLKNSCTSYCSSRKDHAQPKGEKKFMLQKISQVTPQALF